MSVLDKFSDEALIFLLVGFVFAFIFINVDQLLGNTYAILSFMVISCIIVFYVIKKNPIFSDKLVNGRADWTGIVLWTGIGFIAFRLISALVLKQVGTTQSVFDVLQSAAPVLSNVKWIQFVAFGQLIPYIETFLFFALILDIILIQAHRTGADVKDLTVWLIVVGIALVFMLFHLTAKSTGHEQLYVTLVFGIVSMALVLYRRQWIEALLLHILVNSYTMYLTLYSH